MIKKLHPTGTSGGKCVEKVNEIVAVVNALIEGDFPEEQDRWDFVRKLRENLRDAQSEVKK